MKIHRQSVNKKEDYNHKIGKTPNERKRAKESSIIPINEITEQRDSQDHSSGPYDLRKTERNKILEQISKDKEKYKKLEKVLKNSP